MTREQFIRELEAAEKPLRRFLCGVCGGDAFRADDLAQEAMLKAYMHLHSYERRSKFSTWLFRIAWNIYYDSLKIKELQTDSLTEAQTGIADASAGADARFEYQELYRAIGRLSAAEQAVTLLYYMEDKPVKEIAEILDIPAVTVRSHMLRARKHLKEYLKNR